MKFDIRSITSSQINSAKLRIKIKDGSTQIQKIQNVADTSWKETAVNFNNKPLVDTVITQISGTVNGQTLDIDLTSYARSKAGKIFTIALTSQQSNAMYFYSKEAQIGKPVLVIN